jgi:hypothetical protein
VVRMGIEKGMTRKHQKTSLLMERLDEGYAE